MKICMLVDINKQDNIFLYKLGAMSSSFTSPEREECFDNFKRILT